MLYIDLNYRNKYSMIGINLFLVRYSNIKFIVYLKTQKKNYIFRIIN